jgi:dTDP-4-dehydrorhamnose reductase
MRALITGGNGQLGIDLHRHLSASGDDVIAVGRSDLDVADREAVLQCLGATAPDLVYHLAAWTNVDGCETDPQRAYLVNAMGSRFVAEGARLVGARVVSVSTDYVFDGSGPQGLGSSADQRGYTEWDTTGPISHYGRSKLGGEQEMLTLLGPDAAVVRTAWVCGVNGANFVKTMLRLAADPDRKELTVVDDQRGCPTFTTDLAAALRCIGVNRLSGLFHISNDGPLTWCDFARAIFTAGGFDAHRVVAIPTADLLPARPAPRPAFSVLDNAAMRAVGLPSMRHWEPALAETVAALQSS